MRATDLMIGDWVSYNGELLKIYEFKHKYAYFGDGHPLNGILIDEIEPIPLTPEILEKNGWEVSRRKIDRSGRYVLIRPLKEKEWGLVATDDRTIIDFSIGCEEISDVGLKVSLFFCELTVKFGGRIDRVSYVHELQHALRLCGIDKEITL